MIRHRLDDAFLLITQHDHALLSGKFAARWGNADFDRPEPWAEVVEAVGLHDCGWPVHDGRPTLNDKGWPLHVFESPVRVTLPVWTASADRAGEKDPYTGLLVSVHVLSLSAMWMARLSQPGDAGGAGGPPPDRVVMFELLKFQHRESERQEQLRRRLGMRNGVSLRHGLAEPGVDGAEDGLLFNYGLLRALDRLSLDVCCTQPVANEIDGVRARVGAKPMSLGVRHVGRGAVALDPWPFDAEAAMEFEVPCRRVPATPFESEDAFRAAYAAAPAESFPVRVSRIAWPRPPC